MAPGEAELIVERRQSAIQDKTLGWEQVGEPIKMGLARGRGLNRGGQTTWIAHNVKLPSKGQLRLCINQYEVLPSDNRERTRGFYFLILPKRELRLLHQDVIPL